jgi:hypothetical protein
MKSRLVLFLTALNLAIAQNFSTPRGISIAGFEAFVNSALSSGWNPAGLIKIYDWNIGMSGYYELNSGFKMHSFAVAKRISERQSLSFVYSPGSTLEFIFPSNITINIGNTTFKANYDKKITYSSSYAFGYALKPTEKLSIGLNTNYITENISETTYKVQTTDSLPNISLETTEFKSAKLSSKISALYELSKNLSLVFSLENLSNTLGERMPEGLKDFEIKDKIKLKFSTGLSLKNFKFGFELSSMPEVNAGVEISPIDFLFLRCGFFSDVKEINGVSIGAGIKIGLFGFDIAFFKNTSNIWRDGKLTQTEFFETNFRNPNFNKFIRDKILLSISLDALGWYEKSIRINDVFVESEIFPHLMDNFEKKEIGFIKIENFSDKPLNALIDFESPSFIKVETKSNEFKLNPGEIKTIPIFLSVGLDMPIISKATEVNFKVKVGRLRKFYDDEKKFKITLRGRNDWNGEVDKLRYFVRADLPEIIDFTRRIIWEKKDVIDNADPMLRKFIQAKVLIEELSKNITYVSDPSSSLDWVQYPDETLKLHGGDCDDLVVLLASVLESIGIDVAFVDVKEMRGSGESHVYILFDTGIEKKFANVLTENEKRYFIMRNRNGVETIWLPIETTLIREGFEKAWEVGARQFYNDFEINFGHLKGKANIILLQK